MAGDGLSATNLARWNGTTWAGLNVGGFAFDVYALAVYQEAPVVAGGVADAASTMPRNNAAWDG